MKRSHVATILNPDSLNALEKLGDWLVLYFVTENLDTLTVNKLIEQVTKFIPNKLNKYFINTHTISKSLIDICS
jgi:hypothetical protein